jgi:transcription initiation factor TFIIIB Brf1 subunit/transcription initiation factor TFIIB
MFKDTLMGKTEKNYVTKPLDIMPRLLGPFNVSREERLQCNKVCTALEDCVELMSKTPNSIASAIILIVLSDRCSKTEICEKCSVSVPTINKIESIIKKHLEVKAQK